MISFLRAHKGVSVIIFSWVVFCAFVLIPSWREGPFAFVFFSTLFVTMIASQLFWIPRVIGLGERFILGKPQRIWLKVIVGRSEERRVGKECRGRGGRNNDRKNMD